MSHSSQPMIAGAGPVGLAAALFLARQGKAVRIVDMRDKPSQQSKALAVNPRTLKILEPTGLTPRMLELGLPIRGAYFYKQERVAATVSFTGLQSDYPFLLALSQATTERLLTHALEAAGGRVERGLKMVECLTSADQVQVTLEPSDGGAREAIRCPWLLAADGAHSVARQGLGIDFGGTSFAEEWHLADAPLRTALAADHAHVFFLDEGKFLFMIRVVDEALKDRAGEPIWRIMSDHPEPLSELVNAEQAGPALWTSSFHISHRIAETLTAGSTYLAGDAAHVHSPIGARGMNLGLEDAWIFSELVRTNRLAEYDRLRRPVVSRVVHRVELLSRVASAQSLMYRFMRKSLLPLATRMPFSRGRILATVAGLDHELPHLVADGAG